MFNTIYNKIWKVLFVGKLISYCISIATLLFANVSYSQQLTQKEIEAWARQQHKLSEKTGHPRLTLDINCSNGGYLHITSDEIIENRVVSSRYELEIQLVEQEIVKVNGVFIRDSDQRIGLFFEGRHVTESRFDLRGRFGHSGSFGSCHGSATIIKYEEL